MRHTKQRIPRKRFGNLHQAATLQTRVANVPEEAAGESEEVARENGTIKGDDGNGYDRILRGNALLDGTRLALS